MSITYSAVAILIKAAIAGGNLRLVHPPQTALRNPQET